MKRVSILLAAATAAAPAAPAVADVDFVQTPDYALRAVLSGGVLEAGVPLDHNGVRVNDPGTSGSDFFTIVELYDRVPGTGSYPLTAADIVANGYARPLVQNPDGSTSAFGTSVITGPSFRPQGEPIDLIPLMFRADVTTGAAERILIEGRGTYDGRAEVVCRRAYPDPAVGRTEVLVTYTWTAQAAITLPGGSGGRGFDAFRLCTLSSMLADAGGGVYDARYLSVVDPQGRRRTVALENPGAAQHLVGPPRPIAPGGSFALLKDRAATWNPLSPSVEVVVESVGGSVPPPQLGVNAWILGSTNPNDDSLNVWLEWLDAPATIPAGTTLEVSLRIVATPATDPGDLDHDGDLDCHDLVLLDALLGTAEADPAFDAYADLDADGDVDAADRAALAAMGGTYRADVNADGELSVADFAAFRALYLAGDPGADFSGDGTLSVADFTAFRASYLAGCGGEP